MPMHLAIDARSLVEPTPGGVGRVARALVEAYARTFSEDTITCLTTGYARPDLPKEIRALPNVHHLHIRIPNKLWTLGCLLGLCSLEREIRKRHIQTDLLFLPNIGFTGSLKTLPYALLLHDLSFLIEPRWFTIHQRWWHLAVRPMDLIRHARILLAVSETTRCDAATLANIPLERTHTIPVGPTLGPPAHLAPHAVPLPSRYCVTFSHNDPRKNIQTAIESLRILRKENAYNSLELVILGYQDKTLTATPWIHCLRNIDNLKRSHVMSHAEVLLYPSWYEGYGLPLHEAAALGLPRVASVSGALPETAPAGTFFAHPAKPHHWVEAITLALKAPRTPVPAPRTWQEAAEALHAALRSVQSSR